MELSILKLGSYLQMNITIRKLTPDDAEQYRGCRLDALLNAPSAFASSYEEEETSTKEMLRERFREMMDSGENAFIGAFDGELLIGLTGIAREDRQKRNHKMIIFSVFVRPEYQGKKVGSQLIEAAISHARKVEGIERIELSVESNNAPAKALYQSFGFTTWGTEPQFSKIDGVYYDEDYMTLKLLAH